MSCPISQDVRRCEISINLDTAYRNGNSREPNTPVIDYAAAGVNGGSFAANFGNPSSWTSPVDSILNLSFSPIRNYYISILSPD